MKRTDRTLFSLFLFVVLAAAISFSAQAQSLISADQLKVLLESDVPQQLLDIRGYQAYRAGTIKGAVNAGSDPKGYLPDRSNGSVVLIVPEGFDESFLQAWRMRLEVAHDRLYLLEGGVGAWQSAGYEIEVISDAYKESGTVPFVVPRGLCEMGTPAQRFE